VVVISDRMVTPSVPNTDEGRAHSRLICVWVEFNGDPRNADQIWMIGAAVCLRVAGHDVIRPRPSEMARASVAARAAATPADPRSRSR
jgi:hypothetical protein